MCCSMTTWHCRCRPSDWWPPRGVTAEVQREEDRDSSIQQVQTIENDIIVSQHLLAWIGRVWNDGDNHDELIIGN